MFHEYNPHMSCYLIHEVGAAQGKFRQSLLPSLYLLDIPMASSIPSMDFCIQDSQ